MPFRFFGWEGSPTRIDQREKVGTLVLTSLLEDLVFLFGYFSEFFGQSPKAPSESLGVAGDPFFLFSFSGVFC